MNDVLALLLAAALLAGNAFFVGAEFALISARRSQIEPLAETSRRARTTLAAMENVSLMMACAQLGITVCSLGLGAVGEPAVAHLLEAPFRWLGAPEGLLRPAAFTLALMVVVALHVVLGEMVPKNIAIAGPEKAALALAPMLAGVAKVLGPVIRALNAVANGVLRLWRVETRDEVLSSYTAEEVASLAEESRREGYLDADEHELLTGALEFDGRTVASVLLPLEDLVTVGEHSTPAQVQAECARTGYSRYPVTREEGSPPGGELVGYLHVKDVLTRDLERRELPLERRWIRALADVRCEDPLREALSTMQTRGAHLARVLDGKKVVGVVALEDVLEELVGEVRDATQHLGR